MITDIFKSEDAAKPLADQEVVKMLADKGITIARRTVAKYRQPNSTFCRPICGRFIKSPFARLIQMRPWFSGLSDYGRSF